MRSPSDFVSRRAHAVDASGIRKVFDLAAKMKDPINLSIGLPDFDVPDPYRRGISAFEDSLSLIDRGLSQIEKVFWSSKP